MQRRPPPSRGAGDSSFRRTSGTITEFFKDKGVTLEPQKADGFTALNIVLPMPRGLERVPDPNVPDAFTVLADRLGGDGLYTSNAQLKVYKLVGEFDPKEAITHGYVDSQQLFNWQSTDASMADFGGFPSSIIEGTYRENDQTLNTSRRYVIVPVGRRPLPGVAVCDHRGQPGRRHRRRHRCHRQRFPGHLADGDPAAPAGAAAAPARQPRGDRAAHRRRAVSDAGATATVTVTVPVDPACSYPR